MKDFPIEAYVSISIMNIIILVMGIVSDDFIVKNILTIRNNTKISIVRDLVNNEDGEKRIDLKINKKADCEIFHRKIIKRNFLPKTEDNIVWFFKVGDIKLYSFFPKSKKMIKCFVMFPEYKNKRFKEITIDKMLEIDKEIYVECCLAKEYGKQIFQKFNGNHYLMWNEGFLEEYEICEITAEEEEEFRGEIIRTLNNRHI